MKNFVTLLTILTITLFATNVNASESKDVDVYFALGTAYFKGEGVPQDIKQAARWWREAAKQGHSDAQFVIGTMYYHGYGLPQNTRRGVFWLRKAATQGDIDAQELLSVEGYR